MTRKLTVRDISDLRAYERERADFHSRVLALKRVRRVQVGPFVTLTFENSDTVRFQVQEMARVERMMRDDQIQEELDIYNPLIPDPGQLCATMFLELTNDEELREWLPKLTGIERSVEVRIGEGDGAVRVAGTVNAEHAELLTRDQVTAAVHYLYFDVGQGLAERFRRGPVSLAVVHPAYTYQTELPDETKASLLEDVAG